LKAQWEAQIPGLQRIGVLIRPENKSKGSESVRQQAYQEVLILSPSEILISLYRLASNYTPAGSPDRSLLAAQLRVALNSQDEPSLQNLLQTAVDPEGTYITVIGLGLRPWNIFSEEVASPMAKRAARVDAQNWLALIRKALKKGYIESGIPLKTQVYGARILVEQVLPDGSVMLKMLAPL
jgi:hypothetical protein